MEDVSKLYFECHVTIEPVFDERLQEAAELSKKYFFNVADLLMQKRHQDLPTRSKYDTFMTGRHKSYTELKNRMVSLIKELKENGYTVWRAKIEDTIYDSKIDDTLNII